MPTWSDAYLNQLSNDGEIDVSSRTNCPIFYRFSLAVTSGTATYELDSFIKRIQAITWKAKKLTPVQGEELREIDYKYRDISGEPRYYTRSETLHFIRFYPVPNETIAADDTNIMGSDIANRVIISCYRDPDLTRSTFHLPDYVARRTVKAYCLWKAFMKEGMGQNIIAADYYQKKYLMLVQAFRDIKSRYFEYKRDQLKPIVPFATQQPRRVRLRGDFTITP